MCLGSLPDGIIGWFWNMPTPIIMLVGEEALIYHHIVVDEVLKGQTVKRQSFRALLIEF